MTTTTIIKNRALLSGTFAVLLSCTSSHPAPMSAYTGPNLCESSSAGQDTEQVTENFESSPVTEQAYPAVLQNKDISDTTLLGLIQKTSAPETTAIISLSGNKLTNVSFEALANTPMSQVRAVWVSSNQLGIVSLSLLSKFKGLTEVDISNNPLFLDPLPQSLEGTLDTLWQLNLSNVGMKAEHIGIITHEWAPNLKHLRLANNHLQPAGILKLVRSDLFKNLISIDLSRTGLDNDTAIEIFSSDPFSTCGITLTLNGNPLEDSALESFYQSATSTRLRALHIADTNVSYDGVRLLTSSHAFPTLKRLTLSKRTFSYEDQEKLNKEATAKGLAIRWR